MKLSKIAQTISGSPMRKLVPFANEAKKRGIHVYHLNIGDPDIETPEVMIQALKDWSLNPIGYADSHGEKDFLNSLLEYYHNLGFNDLTTDHLQVSIGGSEALLWSFLATANPDDEYIVFEPFYANYNSFATMAHVTLIPVSTTIENGFHLPDASIIEKYITAKTKGILICNPGNPTGTVYTKAELELLVSIAKKHNIFLISDEVYREFTYDGKKAISLLEYVKEYSDGIIVTDSLSKRYSVCGARLGTFISFNQEVMQTALKFAQSRLSAGLVDQVMATKLTDVSPDYFISVNSEYQSRRNLLYDELQKISGVYCQKPEGAFYFIVKLPVEDAEDFAKWLLTNFNDNNETIMIAPAQGFYKTSGLGLNEVRIAYVLNKQSLKRSAELLKLALEQYQK